MPHATKARLAQYAGAAEGGVANDDDENDDDDDVGTVGVGGGSFFDAAMQLYERGLAFFSKLETLVSRVEEDIAQLGQHETLRLGERHVIIIFRDLRLLRAHRLHVQNRIGGAVDPGDNDDDCCCATDVDESVEFPNTEEGPAVSGKKDAIGDDDDETGLAPFFHNAPPTATSLSGSAYAYLAPQTYVWDERALGELANRVRVHQAYLHSLHHRSWTQLTLEERQRITDYVTAATLWCRDVKSRRTRVAYEIRAVQILSEMELLQRGKQDHLQQSVASDAIKRARYCPSQTVGVGGNLFEDLRLLSREHQRLQTLFTLLRDLTLAAESMYGHTKKTGNVVETMTPNPSVYGILNTPLSTVIGGAAATTCSPDSCAACQTARIHDRASASSTCPKCGDNIVYTETTVSFDDHPTALPHGKAYSRRTYALTWLKRVQASLNIDIPDSVYQCVFEECVRRHLRTIVAAQIRPILKTHGYSMYYPAIPAIAQKLNGIPPPRFSEHEMRIFGTMWQQYEDTYTSLARNGNVRNGRKSSLSYAYIFHQCCRIHGWTKYLSCFPLLGGQRNLQEHDRIWAYICQTAGWTFQSTV
jgi:predicted RNA-binding Zn-ribbon protein involved in translation (DUF1610 family)